MASSALPFYLLPAAVLMPLTVAYLPILVIHRLIFHPLATYPGPVLARIIIADALYQAWTGRRHGELFRLHQRYGSVIRVGPNNLGFNSDTAYHDIYGTKVNTRKRRLLQVLNPNHQQFAVLLSTEKLLGRDAHAPKDLPTAP